MKQKRLRKLPDSTRTPPRLSPRAIPGNITKAVERKLVYRNLLDTVEELAERDDYGANTSREVGQILSRVNHLENECSVEERVENANETHMNSSVINTSAQVVMKCVNSVDTSGYRYDPSDFAAKFVGKDDTKEEATAKLLSALLPIVKKVFPILPQYEVVHTPVERTIEVVNDATITKPASQRQKRSTEHRVLSQLERLENVDDQNDGINEIVQEFYKVLDAEYRCNNSHAVDYFAYIIDTDSFSNTIENIFYTSFLVKEGMAHITLDKDLNPMIKPMDSGGLQKFKDEGGSYSQMVANINMDVWERYTTEGFIQKHRKHRH